MAYQQNSFHSFLSEQKHEQKEWHKFIFIFQQSNIIHFYLNVLKAKKVTPTSTVMQKDGNKSFFVTKLFLRIKMWFYDCKH